MRIADIVNESVVDGVGIRLVVFFQGCTLKCVGCQNPATHDLNAGIQYDVKTLAKEICNKLTPLHQGITLSGGDPLEQPEEIPKLIDAIKSYLPRKIDIWCYTGRKWEVIRQIPKLWKVVQKVNVLVDGPFVKELQTFNKPFRGSSNQRLIDVQTSIKKSTVCLLGER